MSSFNENEKETAQIDHFKMQNPSFDFCPSRYTKKTKRTTVKLYSTFAIDNFEIPLLIWRDNIFGKGSVVFQWAAYGSSIADFIEEISVAYAEEINQSDPVCGMLLLRLDDLCYVHPEDRFVVLNKKLCQSLAPDLIPISSLQQSANRLIEDVTKGILSAELPTTARRLFVYIMPRDPRVYSNPEDVEELRLLETQIVKSLGVYPQVRTVAGSCYIKSQFPSNYYTPEMDRLAHSPFSIDAVAIMSSIIFRDICSFRLASRRKVIVLDCDSTLWGGAVGEIGPEGVQISESFKFCQNFFVDLQRKGVLLCICSANIESDVKSVFHLRRTEMPLKWEMITAYKCNWEPKSSNIKSLSHDLSLGLESFIFVDDNMVQCEEVMLNCPRVIVLNLPSADMIKDYLTNCWAFDAIRSKETTEEDSKRTQMYQAMAKRKTYQKCFTSLSAFHASLNLRIDIKKLTIEDSTRAAQLSERTNQHNPYKRQLSAQQLMSMGNNTEDYEIYTVTSSDRFSQHGMVGLIIVDKAYFRQVSSKSFSDMYTYQRTDTEDDNSRSMDLSCGSHDDKAKWWKIHTFLLSCRALHLGIEYAMMRYLAKLAQTEGKTTLAIDWKPSERNEPSRAFFFGIKSTDFIALKLKEIEVERNSCNDLEDTKVRKIARLPGISVYKMSEQKPPEGLILISTEAANTVQLDLTAETSPETKGGQTHESNDETDDTLMAIELEGEFGSEPHSRTYQSIAMALGTDKDHTFLCEYVKSHSKLYDGVARDELERAVQERLKQASKKQDGDVADETQMEDVLTYRERWSLRSQIRHDMKLLMQKNNPDSYLKNVNLDQEINH